MVKVSEQDMTKILALALVVAMVAMFSVTGFAATIPINQDSTADGKTEYDVCDCELDPG